MEAREKVKSLKAELKRTQKIAKEIPIKDQVSCYRDNLRTFEKPFGISFYIKVRILKITQAYIQKRFY